MLGIKEQFIAAAIIFALAATNQCSAGDALASAENAYLTGDYYSAFKFYQMIEPAELPSAIALYNAGLAALLSGDTAAASILWRNSAGLDPRKPWPNFQLAQLAFRQNRLGEALEFIDAALAQDDKIADFLICKAELLLALNRLDEARLVADEALELDAVSSAVLAACASVYNACGRSGEALNLIDRGLERFPDSRLLLSGKSIATQSGDSSRVNDYIKLYQQYYTTETGTLPDIAPATQPVPPGSLFSTGLRYVYRGSWGPFNLGMLVIEVEKPVIKDGMLLQLVTYRIKSNPVLLIIKVNDVYRSWLDVNLDRTFFFEVDVTETWWQYRRLSEFHHDSLRLIQRGVEKDGIIRFINQALPNNLLDGTSILQHARKLVRNKIGGRVATLIDYDFVWTDVEFSYKVVPLEAAGKVWDSYRVGGKAGYTGVAGLSGDFEGWFSADSEAIPLKARFKIFIGSIYLTLDHIEQLSADGDK